MSRSTDLLSSPKRASIPPNAVHDEKSTSTDPGAGQSGVKGSRGEVGWVAAVCGTGLGLMKRLAANTARTTSARTGTMASAATTGPGMLRWRPAGVSSVTPGLNVPADSGPPNQYLHPTGAGGQAGSGCQSGGGVQPRGTGQPGGGLKVIGGTTKTITADKPRTIRRSAYIPSFGLHSEFGREYSLDPDRSAGWPSRRVLSCREADESSCRSGRYRCRGPGCPRPGPTRSARGQLRPGAPYTRCRERTPDFDRFHSSLGLPAKPRVINSGHCGSRRRP